MFNSVLKTQKQPRAVFLKISSISLENTCVGVSFNKVAGLKAFSQVFSCEICEIFKNTYYEEYLRTTAFKYASINMVCTPFC